MLTQGFFFAEIATYWEQEWDWETYENREKIKEGEWKHVRWLYDNCNWRRGWARGTFAVTSTTHGAPIGVASNACETLYKLLKEVREYYEEMGGERAEKKWEGVYVKIVKKKENVMRKKGKERREKPRIVNWGK